MFDVGFAELVIIAVVGLLVIGPERLPGAIRTGAAWLNRFNCRGKVTVKQGNIQVRLKLAHVLGHGALGDAQLLCGGAET